MKRTTVILSSIVLSAVLLAACGAGAPSALTQRSGIEAPAAEPMAPAFEMDIAEEGMVAGDGAGLDQAVVGSMQERLVVRNANLSIVVDNPEASVASISRLAESMGGFVVSSNVYQTSYGDSRLEEAVIAKQASITIRVPSDQLDQALDQIKDAAVEVRSQNMSGQDVTEEYTDLQSRLGNLEAAESELREIMESASERDEIEDVLAVLNELRRVREEIEVLRGRIQYLEQSARLSSISVELLPDVASQPLQIGRWTPEGTAREAVEALVGALQNLAEAGIYVVICGLPAAILLGVPAWLGLRAIRRRGTAAPAKPEKAN
jgi:hypothetical protein